MHHFLYGPLSPRLTLKLLCWLGLLSLVCFLAPVAVVSVHHLTRIRIGSRSGSSAALDATSNANGAADLQPIACIYQGPQYDIVAKRCCDAKTEWIIPAVRRCCPIGKYFNTALNQCSTCPSSSPLAVPSVNVCCDAIPFNTTQATAKQCACPTSLYNGWATSPPACCPANRQVIRSKQYTSKSGCCALDSSGFSSQQNRCCLSSTQEVLSSKDFCCPPAHPHYSKYQKQCCNSSLPAWAPLPTGFTSDMSTTPWGMGNYNTDNGMCCPAGSPGWSTQGAGRCCTSDEILFNTGGWSSGYLQTGNYCCPKNKPNLSTDQGVCCSNEDWNAQYRMCCPSDRGFYYQRNAELGGCCPKNSTINGMGLTAPAMCFYPTGTVLGQGTVEGTNMERGIAWVYAWWVYPNLTF